MRITETVEIPARSEERVKETLCDMCGKDVERGMCLYDVDSVTVQRRTGADYPEGGTTTVTSFDICGACFDSLLIPFVDGFMGAQPRVTEDIW